MRLLSELGFPGRPLRLRLRSGWLRNLGSGGPGARAGLGSPGNLALVLLAVGALLSQALGLYYEIDRRTIRYTAGIDIDSDLVITPKTEVARELGIQDGDQLVGLNGQPVTTPFVYRRLLDRLPVGSELTLTVQRDGQAIDLPPIVVERILLDPVVPVRQVTGLAFLVMGVVVVVFGSRERATRSFFLASLLLGLYVGLLRPRATGLIYLQAAALAFAPAAVIHFFLRFPRERSAAASRWMWLLYVPSLVLAVAMIVAYNDALQAGWGFYKAPAYAILTDKVGFTYLGLSGVLGLAVMGHAYATALHPVERRRLQWIILGLSFSMVAAVTDLILTWSKLHSPQTSLWLVLGFLPIPITFVFAILRYRLWDLDLVINRSVVYSLVTAVLVAVYLTLVSGLSTLLGIAAGDRGYTVVLFLSALLIGFLFSPLRSRIQSVIDRVFFRRQVDHQAALARWSEELSTSLRFADLARLLLEEVRERLQIDRAWLLVLNEGEDCLLRLDTEVEGAGADGRVGSGSARMDEQPSSPGPAQDLAIPVHSALALDLNRPGTVLLLNEGRGPGETWLHPAAEDLPSDASSDGLPAAPERRGPFVPRVGEESRDLVAEWKRAGVGLVLPLISGRQGGEDARSGRETTRLVGIYLLGHKLSGDVYQRQEMEFLRTLSNQAAIAIANARLYEQVTGFSQELELKVQDRTKELRDFVSAVYHELSTPITSIRGFTDVLLEREGAKLNDRQRRYLVTVRRNVGRLMRLVADLSDVSRIDDGRLTIHPEPIDLRQVVSDTVASLAGIVEAKGLQVTVSIASDVTLVEGDRHRVMQILSNLLTNACRYTPAGGQITIAARVQEPSPETEGRGYSPGGARLVEVTVADTGIGIHTDDLDHIFERFYRSEDPMVQEQSGTGLGLSITKSLVELHGSHLWVDSTVGKGSTFGFALPGPRIGLEVDAEAKGATDILSAMHEQAFAAETDPDVGGPYPDVAVGWE